MRSCSLSLYLLAYFFSLENAVSTMFVTSCTLAEPLLKVVWNPLWIGVLDLLVL